MDYIKLLKTCQDRFSYNRETGKLIYKKDMRRVKAGCEAGVMTHQGYLRIKVCGNPHQAHRLIWLMHYGSFPTGQVDHIDRDKSNNKIENLREVTGQQNNFNSKSRKGSSQFKGVNVRKCGKWAARIRKDGKQFNIGEYATEEMAAKAYDKKAREFFGVFAYLNFP
jgi:hypothetical protein